MEVVRLQSDDEEGRLVIRFTQKDTIEISGHAASSDMALAAAVLSKMAVDSLEQK